MNNTVSAGVGTLSIAVPKVMQSEEQPIINLKMNRLNH
jgi:hypothetical protein